MKKILLFILLPIIVLAQTSATTYLPSDANTVANFIFDSVYRGGVANITKDESGNCHDLVANGFSASFADELTGTSPVYAGGNALTFNGSTEYFQQATADAILNFGNVSFTIEMWFKPDGPFATDALSWRDVTKWMIYSNATTGRLGIRYNTAWIAATANPLIVDTWCYAAIVVDVSASKVRFYVNGSDPNEQSITPADISSPTATLAIGRTGAGTGYMDGTLAQIRISNIARTTAYIQGYWNGALNPVTDTGQGFKGHSKFKRFKGLK